MSHSQSQAFLVTGATGSQGGAVARALLAAGQKVHALVRDPTSTPAQQLAAAGAHLFQGDFSDTVAIAYAAKGCTGVFVNVLPTADPNAEVTHAQNLISASLSAGVTKCVYTSVVNAEKHSSFKTSNRDGTFTNFNPDTGIKFLFTFRASYWLAKSTIQSIVQSATGFTHYTILQPAFLLPNLLPPSSRFYFPTLASPPHTLRTAYTSTTPIAITDPVDIGEYAVAALIGHNLNNKIVHVACLEKPTMNDMVRAMSEVSGREVRPEYLSEDDFWQQRGSIVLVASQGWARDGWTDVDVEVVKEEARACGVEVGTLKGFLKRERIALGRNFEA